MWWSHRVKNCTHVYDTERNKIPENQLSTSHLYINTNLLLWHRDVIMFFLSRRKCVYLSHRTWMNYEKHQFQQRWAQSLLQQSLRYPHFLGGTQILWYQQQNSLDYTCMVLPLKYKEVRESVTSRHLLGNKSPNHHTLHFAAEHTSVWAIVNDPRKGNATVRFRAEN